MARLTRFLWSGGHRPTDAGEQKANPFKGRRGGGGAGAVRGRGTSSGLRRKVFTFARNATSPGPRACNSSNRSPSHAAPGALVHDALSALFQHSLLPALGGVELRELHPRLARLADLGFRRGEAEFLQREDGTAANRGLHFVVRIN